MVELRDVLDMENIVAKAWNRAAKVRNRAAKAWSIVAIKPKHF